MLKMFCIAFVLGLLPCMSSALVVQGMVLDLNGRTVPQAMITLDRGAQARGASHITVFSNTEGRFVLPTLPAGTRMADWHISVRALGYRPVSPAADPVSLLDVARVQEDVYDLLFVLQPVANRAATAPASAWLQALPDERSRHLLISECVGCHQFPTAQVREFAAALDRVPSGDPLRVRRDAWHLIIRYMRARFVEGLPQGSPVSLDTVPFEVITNPSLGVTSAADEDALVELLATGLPDRLDTLASYEFGAAYALTPRTVIREYQMAGPNGIRETIAVSGSKYLWVADSWRNRLVRLNPDTGGQLDYDVPFDGPTGPHTLLRSRDGYIWVAMLDSAVLGRLDPASGDWRLWRFWGPDADEPSGGPPPGVHDLAFDADMMLASDSAGRVWMTDISRNGLIGLNTETGAFASYPAPAIPDRSPSNIAMYGIVMAADKKTVWYTQLLGNLGAFNTETLEYETIVELPVGAGPRRLAITADDMLWVPLFGAGQIMQYDARARRIVKVYNLPDRASAPYAVTWDADRGVLWIATSNADVIYRFEPLAERFGVIPLPRSRAFLRMLAIHPDTGELLTSYANLPVTAKGPRMALSIDIDDESVPEWSSLARSGASGEAADATGLLRENSCHNCHALDEPRIGPPYRAIAMLHRSRSATMREVLAQKIVHGGAGNWGTVPMVANHDISPEEARAMARWILSLPPRP
jgi:streptogramin lyase/cytochrome c551/c552